MLNPRKLIAVIAVAAVPLAALVAVGYGTAGASPTAKVAAAQAGTVKCTKGTGTATMVPPITTNGTKAATTETLTLTATVTSCKASKGANPSKGVASTKLVVKAAGGYANACLALTGIKGKPVVTVKWTRATALANSVVTFPNFTLVNLTAGDIGFKLPQPGGKPTSTGSYPGTNKGASSTAAFYLNGTAAAFLAQCGTTKGISSLKIASGSATVG